MGEVYRPEDIVGDTKRPSDMSPNLDRLKSLNLKEVMREIRLLKAEIKKIKQALRANGIIVE